MSPFAMAPMQRRQFLRFVGAAGAATAFTGSLSACGGPASTGSAGNGATDTIEAGISYTLSTGFDPMTATGATPVAANLHVFEGLVDLDPVTREPYPALAAALPEQRDDTTLRVTLRSRAKFHDGSPVTADDVVYSYERVLDPANESLYATFIPFVERVEAVDDTTVDITLKYPFALVNERLGVVKIVPRRLVEADPKSFDANPVGSGPFALVESIKDDKLVFEKFAGYNGPRPARVSSMTWRLLDDPTARVTALESERVQAIEDVPYIDIDRLAKVGKVEQVQSFGMLFLMFNCASAPFDDRRVRQALHYAIDKRKLIDSALLGGASAAVGYTPRSHPDHLEPSTVYTYDPDKAKALLKAAGVSNLSIDLVATNTGWVQDAAPFIKEDFDAIGVRTNLDIGESGGQYADKVATGRYQVMIAPGDPSVFGNDLDLLLRWYNYGNWPTNYSYWSRTPEYERATELMDEAVRSTDEGKRRDLWQKVVDLIAEEAHTYPLLHRKLPTGWKPDELDGFAPLPTTGLSFLDVGRG